MSSRLVPKRTPSRWLSRSWRSRSQARGSLRIPRPGQRSRPTTLCECGCGAVTTTASRSYVQRGVKLGEHFRFIKGHQRRGIHHTEAARARISAGVRAAVGPRDPRTKRRWVLTSLYGVASAEVEDILDLQDAGGKCPICGAEGELVVDHIHPRGGFRGLLCQPCNRGLGLFYENPAALRAAAEYVEAHASLA